jgi:hypothetical protein
MGVKPQTDQKSQFGVRVRRTKSQPEEVRDENSSGANFTK